MPREATPPQLEGYADWLKQTMSVWKVPGLAVGIVKDGQVVFLEGFGVRDTASGSFRVLSR